MIIRIYNDNGEPISLAFLKSRTVWVSVALAILNAYEAFLGIDPAMLAQFGITLNDQAMHAINIVGLGLAAYFRIAARQPLGKGKLAPITPEEIAKLRAEWEAETKE